MKERKIGNDLLICALIGVVIIILGLYTLDTFYGNECSKRECDIFSGIIALIVLITAIIITLMTTIIFIVIITTPKIPIIIPILK